MAGWLSKPNEHERVTALLSPYLDGHTSVAERARVERHLASCAECARDLATLNATVGAIRELPRVRAPRSFALPRSMARQPQPTPRLVPALRAATALATLLFAVLIGGDVFLANSLQRTAAPAPASIALESGVLSAPTASLEKSAQVAPQAFDVATQSAQKAGRAALATPVEPQAEQPLQPGGLGAGGGNLPPVAAQAAPVRPPTALTNEAEPLATAASKLAASAPGVTPTVTLTTVAPSSTAPLALTAKAGSSATPPATVVIQAAASVPPSTPAAAPTTTLRRDAATPVAPQPANLLRVAEGALALLAMAFGVTAWLANRRRR
jgi:hypothetical protein